MTPKETAKQNLLKLIDYCVTKGNIFSNAQTVAEMVNSVHVLGADHTDADSSASNMMLVKSAGQPSASEQLQARIDNP